MRGLLFMGFAGELTTIGLSEVFQNVAFNRLTGTLVITERDRRAEVYFEGGKARAVAPGHERVLDYAVIVERAGAVSAETLRSLGKRRRRKALKAALAHAGALDEERFDAAIADQVREEIILLFGWRNASFVFEEGRPDEVVFDKEQLGCRIFLDPQSISMEAARRMDEWESISRHIVSEKEIFLPVADAADDELTELQAQILSLLDGTRDLTSVIEEVAEGKFRVLKETAQLVERGMLTFATATHLRDLAARAQAAGDVNRAARHLEAALEREAGDLEARRDLIRLYERAGRKMDAAREHKRLAFAQTELGDLEGALSSYERAAVLVPYDTDSLRRILEIRDARGERAEMIRAGRTLAEALAAQGMLEDAREMYRRLLEEDPGNASLRESLAATHIKLHEPKEAAGELLHLARRACEKGEYDAALHYYRNVLAVDRGSEEAKEKIESIESGRLQVRRKTRVRRILLAASTLLISLSLWQLAREFTAQSALHNASRASTAALAQDPSDKSLIATLRHYSLVCEDYPFTRASSQSEQLVRELLLDEIQRIEIAAAVRPPAAEKSMSRVDAIRLPKDIRAFWSKTRDGILESIERRKENAKKK